MAQHSVDDELDEDTAAAGDQADDQEQEEEEQAPATPRRKGGRPRSGATLTATAVFKEETEFQEFEQEASERNESVSAYALHVLLNRHNTVDGVSDWKRERRTLKNRITALEGAKEQLQGMYEQERSRAGSGLAGLDATPAAMTPKEIQRLVAAGIAERDREQKLALLPVVQAELEKTQKELEDLEEKYDDLQDEMERLSNFETKVQTYAPTLVNGLLGQFPNLAKSIASSPLGALAGLTPDSVGLPAPTSDPASDPLIAAALRTRDEISPKQGRELEMVLDAIAKNPGFVTRFAQAIQQHEQAQQAAQAATPPTPQA